MVIFGDSHVGLYRNVPGIRLAHLGPVTMHRIGRDGLASCGARADVIWPYKTIGFLCGEIDVRTCFARQCSIYGRDAQEVADRLAQEYCRAISVFVGAAGEPGASVAVFAVPPPVSGSPCSNPAFSRHGTDEERAGWTHLLNASLRHASQDKSFAFVDQHSMFANAHGLLDVRFTTDDLHIDGHHAALVGVHRQALPLVTQG